MIEHKSINPLQPGQWKTEPELMRRLEPPGHVHIDGAYTNVSDTCEECVSSQAHVVGFAISYHDYKTHKTYLKKPDSMRKKHVYLGWLKDYEMMYGQPTEWNQRYDFGCEHPYYNMSAADIPDKVKSHHQIRKEKEAAEAARAAREAPTSSPSEEPEGQHSFPAWPASPLSEEPEGASSSSGFCLDSSLFA